jgi:hypothetical protein
MGTIDCFPGTFFTSCGFIVDGGPEVDSAITIDSSISPGTSLTILFFGLDRNSGHNGIPSDSGPLGLGNFEINLNTISCVGGICSQPLDNSHPGGWITGGSPNHFDAQANVPEPGSWILLLSVLGVLAARGLMRRNRRCV